MAHVGTINIPKDVLANFRSAVFAKHGRLYGRLMTEAGEALQAHAERIIAERKGP